MIGLAAPQNNMSIYVPHLSALTALQQTMEYLDMSGNHIAGSIPADLFLPKLQHWNMQNNQVTGSLPASLFGTTTLKLMVLDGNRFTGSIPALDNLTELNVFSVSYNQLTGMLPMGWQSLPQLTRFAASGNMLTGSISMEPQLGEGGEWHQGLHSCVAWAFNCVASMLSCMPAQLMLVVLCGAGKELTILLDNNQLTGTVGVELALAPIRVSPAKLLLSYAEPMRNSLESDLPWRRLQHVFWLQTLDLSNNHLHGNIDALLSQPQLLSDLSVSNNK